MRTGLTHTLAATSIVMLIAPLCFAADAPKAGNNVPTATVKSQLPDYGIEPGDVLIVSVWKEESLQAEVLVRPDGGISFPLAGDIAAAGKTVDQLRQTITERLIKYIPDPVVTVGIKVLSGSRIYVIGKVNRPGEFPVTRYVDVMQALSMAGGANPFAAVNDIKILRRDNGVQRAINFRYSDVESGKKLEQNIILQSGDEVVVP